MSTLKEELEIFTTSPTDERMEKIENMLNELIDSHRALLELVGAIKEQVEPMLDSLSNSPMVKMMFGGK